MTGVSDFLIKNTISGNLYKQGGSKNEVLFERKMLNMLVEQWIVSISLIKQVLFLWDSLVL